MTAFVISILTRLLYRVCVGSLNFLFRGLFLLSGPRRPLRALWPMAAQDHQSRVRLDGCFDVLLRAHREREVALAEEHRVPRWSFHKSHIRERDVQRHPRDLIRVDRPGVPFRAPCIGRLGEVQAVRTTARQEGRALEVLVNSLPHHRFSKNDILTAFRAFFSRLATSGSSRCIEGDWAILSSLKLSIRAL